MPPERKSAMVSVRLSAALAARLDFVVRNVDTEGIKNRSTAVVAALAHWLPTQEARLEELGIITKKAPRT